MMEKIYLQHFFPQHISTNKGRISGMNCGEDQYALHCLIPESLLV